MQINPLTSEDVYCISVLTP